MTPREIVETMAQASWDHVDRGVEAVDGVADRWEQASETRRDMWRAMIGAAINAASVAGYVIVPREPTEAMLVAGDQCDRDVYDRASQLEHWESMIAAWDGAND